jgi:general secretion pathway protein M
MTPATNTRHRVVVSYALLCLIAGGLVFAILGPAVAMRRNFSDDLASAREQHTRFTAAIADATAAAAELETRAESVDLSAFFAADTNVLAAADLQNQLRTLIGERRGTVTSMNVVPTAEEGVFPPIGVTAILQCSIDCLMEILYAVETQSPALFVDELSVQSLHQPGRVLPTRDVELEIRLTVTGYRYVAAGGGEQQG